MYDLLEAITNLNKSNNQTIPGLIHTAILYAYSEPHRVYHRTSHLHQLLKIYEEVLNDDPYAVETHNQALFALALAEHDVVYITGYKGTVEASANLAGVHGKMLGMSQKEISLLKVLIRATEHSCESDTKLKKKGTNIRLQLIRDMDLAILGTPWPTFRQYDADIDKEFSTAGCDPELFIKGRREFLERYLRRKRIFLTDYCYIRFEEQARENLECALMKLYPNTEEENV